MRGNLLSKSPHICFYDIKSLVLVHDECSMSNDLQDFYAYFHSQKTFNVFYWCIFELTIKTFNR